MEAQMTEQGMPMSRAETKETKPSSWKTSVLYAVLAALFLLALAAYGHSQGWFKQIGGKAGDVIAATFPSTAPSAAVEDSMAKARTAFATGDVNGALEGYRQIIAKNPEDMGARGELGNVLYAVGMVAEAAQAYFDTASMAIDQNQPEIAEALLPAIIEGNPMLATQLNDKLFEAQVRTHMAQRPMQEPLQQQPMPSVQGAQNNNS
jgi:tetratricopeptide (TPR) repeat protein